MHILIGCEESGVVRRAFTALGHNAWSNDLEPSRDNSPYHLQCDVFEAVSSHMWDIIILHPDCTKMAVCGNSTWANTSEREDQIQWTLNLWLHAKLHSHIGCALENPASVIWPRIRPVSHNVQYIQPWQFGHMEQKKTGLGLFNLPPLKETNNVYAEMMKLPIATRERIHYMAPSKTRKRDRSETFTGIADAMAKQWGNLSQSA